MPVTFWTLDSSLIAQQPKSTMAIVSRPARLSLAALLTGISLLLHQNQQGIDGFVPTSCPAFRRASLFRSVASSSSSNNDADDDSNNNENEADRLRQQAAKLREQIRSMEEKLGSQRTRNYPQPQQPANTVEQEPLGMSLKGKRVLVVGANGRLGSMVCRQLLRNHADTQVVAMCHYIGEDSPTSRGYGRLSYEVGAEDGIGSQGPAWSADDRTATFQYADYMKDYNLQNLRVVECELLDPVQCSSVVEGCDAVVWCATDFNGNTPRAVSSLNVALLFRAVADLDKGRVEVEGLQNMLGAFKNAKQEKKRQQTGSSGGSSSDKDSVCNFVLVSAAPDAYEDFETPFGSFKGIKRQGETMVREDFPSLSHTILQLSRFEDNFVQENMDVLLEEADATTAAEAANDPTDVENKEKTKRRINRRDAAKAVVQALTSEGIVGKTVEVWTDITY